MLVADFNASFHGLTHFHDVGESITETENVDGHERHLARTRTGRCCGTAGPDGDEHMDGRKLRTGTVHTKQVDGTWGRTDAHGLYHGIEGT